MGMRVIMLKAIAFSGIAIALYYKGIGLALVFLGFVPKPNRQEIALLLKTSSNFP